jgi:hypothetical protein
MIKRLMLFRETVASYCENDKKHRNKPLGQTAYFQIFKADCIYIYIYIYIYKLTSEL